MSPSRAGLEAERKLGPGESFESAKTLPVCVGQLEAAPIELRRRTHRTPVDDFGQTRGAKRVVRGVPIAWQLAGAILAGALAATAAHAVRGVTRVAAAPAAVLQSGPAPSAAAALGAAVASQRSAGASPRNGAASAGDASSAVFSGASAMFSGASAVPARAAAAAAAPPVHAPIASRATAPGVPGSASLPRGAARPPEPWAASPPATPAAVAPQPALPAISEAEPSVLPDDSSDDWLGAQLALLARAERSLLEGNPADALRSLDEYEARFPRGLIDVQVAALRERTWVASGTRALKAQ